MGYSIICSTFLRFSSGNNSQPQYQTNRLCWYSKWIPVWIARATAYLSTSQSFVYHSLSAHQTSLLEVYIAKSNQSVNLTRFLLHLEQLISWDSISWFNRFEYLTSIRFFRTCNNLRVFNWGLIIWLCLNERGVGRTYFRWDSSGWKNGKGNRNYYNLIFAHRGLIVMTRINNMLDWNVEQIIPPQHVCRLIIVHGLLMSEPPVWH